MMNVRLKIALIMVGLFVCNGIESVVRIILTAALADRYYDLRKTQYLESFRLLKSHGYENVYVVESLKKQGPTFLDDCSSNVFYSQANNPHILPGYNEAITLLDALYHFGFDPEDIIIKLTGRHQFVSDEFLKYVHENPDGDIFVKAHNLQEQSPHEVHTLAFAMRCKYLIQMCEWVKQIVPTLPNPRRTPLEMLQCSFISQLKSNPTVKIHYVQTLGVRAHMLGSTTFPEAGDDYNYR